MAPYTGLRVPQPRQVRLSQYRAAGRVASLRIDLETALGLLCLDSWTVLGQGRSGRMDSLRLRVSIQACKISTAAIRSTALARFSILISDSRKTRFASVEVRRSSNRWTGIWKRFASSAAKRVIFSA